MGHLRLLLAALVILVCGGTSATGALRVVVQPGDTLVRIGERHGVTATTLARLNGLKRPDLLTVGVTLTVPGSSSTSAARPRRPSVRRTVSTRTHTVRQGETLAAIAGRLGTTPAALARMNGIADPDRIVVGTRLRVTGSGATAAAARRATPATTGYTIRPGDTLSAIAARHGVSAASIARRNRLRNPNLLTAGRRLTIAGAKSTTVRRRSGAASAARRGRYVVRTGDNLAAIAARHGTTAAALARRNGLRNANVLHTGQRLIVPAGGRTSSATSATPGATVARITTANAGWAGQPSRAEVAAQISRSAARYGVDPALVRAVAWQESGWWQGARSNVGAMGVMQLMPETVEWAGPSLVGRRLNGWNLRDNVDGGTALLAWLLKLAPSRDVAIASYYQGLGSVTSRGMYTDTKQYVSSVKGHYGRR